MFTGIIEEAGQIASLRRAKGSMAMSVRASLAGRGVKVGDSVAVSGCCLTAIKVVREGREVVLDFDLLEETWRRTCFGQLKEGDLVNLERSLRASDRLGGHFVTGHVDGTGEIARWERSGQDWVLEVRPPAGLMRYFLEKGSVAIDGMSLTVAEVLARTIRVWIIPHTWEVTNLRRRRVGEEVNLEADLLGKYVERFIAARDSTVVRPRRPVLSKARSRGRA